MEYWNDFITREDLETESGEIDQDIVRILSMNTYLLYVGDFISLGGNQLPDIASEQVEEFMVNDFTMYTHATEGRYPEPEEIREHLRQPENVEARKYWTWLCVHSTEENWPETVKRIREEWNIPEEITLKNEERIRLQMKQAAEKRTWKYRIL